MIYHLALERDLSAARAAGEYRVSSLGRTLEEEGFVHASFADQVAGVAERYYGGVQEALVLLAVEESRLGSPVIVENGFPHVYGPIELQAVVAEHPLTRGADGLLVLPDLAAQRPTG